MADTLNKPAPPAFGGGSPADVAQLKKTVATPSDEVSAMRHDWEMTRTLMKGTAAIRKEGVKYLPQYPKEPADKYTRRKAVSTLFPAFKRTVVSLASRPFSTPLTIPDNMPQSIKDLLKDIDLQARSLDEVGNDLMQIQLAEGFGGIMCDHKVAPKKYNADGSENTAPLTKQEEKDAGLRPYFVIIWPLQILGWKFTVTAGQYKLTMLRYMETVDEDDGTFDTKKVEQVRVLEPGKWTTYRKNPSPTNSEDEWVKKDSGITTLSYIPFTPIYGERLGFMCGKSPLQELAYLNVKHYQQQSDQDNLMHTARVPILTVTGVEDSEEKPFKFELGNSGAIKLPSESTMEYVEHTGAAISAGKQQLDDLKEEMRQSGAELLVLKPGPTTATEIASDNAVGMCDLQRMALNLQDALNNALKHMADWLKEPAGIGDGVKIFTDFAAATLAEASASLLVGLANSGKLSDETLIAELKRRGILSPEVTYEDERDKIDAQGPALVDPLNPNPAKKPPSKKE